MNVALCVITDGRDHIWEMMESLTENIDYQFSVKLLVDDSMDESFRDRFVSEYGDFQVDSALESKRGFGGAIRTMWADVAGDPDIDYIFHMEDDFVFRHSIDIKGMVAILQRNPHVAQVSLRRGAVNAHEESYWYLPGLLNVVTDGEYTWREHRDYFTTNPSVYRNSLTSLGWPEDPESEGKFGIKLFSDPDRVVACWGGEGVVSVDHIGIRRGEGY